MVNKAIKRTLYAQGDLCDLQVKDLGITQGKDSHFKAKSCQIFEPLPSQIINEGEWIPTENVREDDGSWF